MKAPSSSTCAGGSSVEAPSYRAVAVIISLKSLSTHSQTSISTIYYTISLSLIDPLSLLEILLTQYIVSVSSGVGTACVQEETLDL